MYSWKSKFKFGKSKEEKEAKHSGFFHSSKKEEQQNNQATAGEHDASITRSSLDRKGTINPSNSSVVPVRVSTMHPHRPLLYEIQMVVIQKTRTHLKI